MEKTDLSSLFDFDSPSTSNASREGESEPFRAREDEPSRFVVGSIPCPMREERWIKPNEEQNLRVYTRQPMDKERWRKPNEEENLRVYTRRQPHQQQGQTNGEIQLQGEQHQQQILRGDEVDSSKSAMHHQ
jgi:hypothetical protein